MSGLVVIVLASGLSKRFGKNNKLLMPLNNKTVIELTLENVIKADITRKVIVVTQHKKIVELFENRLNVEVITNKKASLGISSSIFLGIDSRPNVSGYMFIQGDQPLLKAETIQKLVNTFKLHPERIVVPVYEGVYGSPKIFPHSLRTELMALEGDSGGRDLIRKYKNYVIEVPVKDSIENWDIDTVEDYTHIKERFL